MMSFSLRSSSDRDILSRLQELVRRERSLTLSVLLHLNEIERRRLHLKQGYASMFDYCTNALGYSASAAGRRIQTARCVARFPEVYVLLEANEVNLTTISEVSRVLTATSKDDLLARIRGKSQREVKAIVAEYDPRAAIPRDQVRPVVLRTPGRPSADAQPGTDAVTAAAVEAASPGPAPPSREACEESDYSRSGTASQSSADVTASAATGGAATFAVLHVIKFAASGAFMQ
ncbi:MAG TPA: hypothetical protein VFT13_00970, partial [Candidatus Krumholzibacteria bacterium]|nr:hypothetical protein [Candidatus Krumholzibacteria bacterium]